MPTFWRLDFEVDSTFWDKL